VEDPDKMALEPQKEEVIEDETSQLEIGGGEMNHPDLLEEVGEDKEEEEQEEEAEEKGDGEDPTTDFRLKIADWRITYSMRHWV